MLMLMLVAMMMKKHLEINFYVGNKFTTFSNEYEFIFNCALPTTEERG
jgi:hypothetical protein